MDIKNNSIDPKELKILNLDLKKKLKNIVLKIIKLNPPKHLRVNLELNELFLKHSFFLKHILLMELHHLHLE